MIQTYIAQIKTLYSVDESEALGFSAQELKTLENRLNVQIPAALRSYYLALGKDEVINHSFNHLIPLAEISLSDDGFFVFYSENQGVGCWGIKKSQLTEENPAVYVNYDLAGSSSEWLLDSQHLDGFLLNAAIINAVLGGAAFNANSFHRAPQGFIAEIEANWQELKDLTEHKQRIFTRNFNDVMLLCINPEDQVEGVFLGSQDSETFEKLLESLDLNWDYISEEDEN